MTAEHLRQLLWLHWHGQLNRRENSLLCGPRRGINGCVMTNNQVISIPDRVRKPKPKRIAVPATKAIELPLDFVADATAILPKASRQPVEGSASADPICFQGCSEAEARKAVMRVSSLEELTTFTSTWRLPQLVSMWNQIPGVRRVTRFENRSIALERLWRALAGLQTQAAEAEDKPKPEEKKKQAGPSKSERLIGLLRTPGGATLQALMEASGWQAHSVRGFLSGKLSKQLGLPVASFRRDGERVYALPPAAAAQEQPQWPADPSRRNC